MQPFNIRNQRVRLIASNESHIAQAFIDAVEAGGNIVERDIVDAEYPIEDQGPGVESQQIDQAEAKKAQKELIERLEKEFDVTTHTGQTQVFVLTDGMFAGDDAAQKALLKTAVSQAIKEKHKIAAVVLPTNPAEAEVEPGTTYAEANASLETYLESYGIPLYTI